MYPHISEINPAAKFYGKITGQSTLQIPCSWEYCFCWSHSTVTKALWTSECTQVSPVLSIVTKGHFSWDAFLNVWKCLLCWRCFYRCMINKLGHAFPWTRNGFANGALIPKIYSTCSFPDAMLSSRNFIETFFCALCLLCMRRELPRANLHIHVFCACALRPKVASVSFSTKASATLWKNRKGHFFFFHEWENLELFWEAICISGMPYWFWWFSGTNTVQP